MLTFTLIIPEGTTLKIEPTNDERLMVTFEVTPGSSHREELAEELAEVLSEIRGGGVRLGTSSDD